MHCHMSPLNDEEHAYIGMNPWEIEFILNNNDNNINTKTCRVKYF